MGSNRGSFLGTCLDPESRPYSLLPKPKSQPNMVPTKPKNYQPLPLARTSHRELIYSAQNRMEPNCWRPYQNELNLEIKLKNYKVFTRMARTPNFDVIMNWNGETKKDTEIGGRDQWVEEKEG